LVDLWLGTADRDLSDPMTAGKALATCREVLAFVEAHPDLPARADKRWAVRRRMVRAHAALEHWDEAMRLCEALRTERPDTLEVEEDLAACYIAAGRFDDAQRHLAGMLGRTVEGSEPWWRVKLASMTCGLRSGHYEETLGAIRALAVLYPSMGGPALKPEFQKIRKACEAKVPR
ncbi:MAG: tetratricopeptide repeat protein, partial [Planctomycetes bacterium]|nr:tetratricopeptide repeat protein [Planctomycetota bacterium]